MITIYDIIGLTAVTLFLIIISCFVSFMSGYNSGYDDAKNDKKRE